jgi:hypothetical protein
MIISFNEIALLQGLPVKTSKHVHLLVTYYIAYLFLSMLFSIYVHADYIIIMAYTGTKLFKSDMVNMVIFRQIFALVYGMHMASCKCLMTIVSESIFDSCN